MCLASTNSTSVPPCLPAFPLIWGMSDVSPLTLTATPWPWKSFTFFICCYYNLVYFSGHAKMRTACTELEILAMKREKLKEKITLGREVKIVMV